VAGRPGVYYLGVVDLMWAALGWLPWCCLERVGGLAWRWLPWAGSPGEGCLGLAGVSGLAYAASGWFAWCRMAGRGVLAWHWLRWAG
jgi:hypothetical protein